MQKNPCTLQRLPLKVADPTFETLCILKRFQQMVMAAAVMAAAVMTAAVMTAAVMAAAVP